MNRVIPTLLLAAFIGACSMPSKQFAAEPDQPFVVDRQAAAQTLAGALTYQTVLTQEATLNESVFKQFHQYLEAQFPLVHQHLQRETINGLSLLYTWQGAERDSKPILFLSHQDVVPADHPHKWQHPPFSGHFDSHYIYGRGAIDVKFGVVGALEAAERLLAMRLWLIGCQACPGKLPLSAPLHAETPISNSR